MFVATSAFIHQMSDRRNINDSIKDSVSEMEQMVMVVENQEDQRVMPPPPPPQQLPVCYVIEVSSFTKFLKRYKP